MGRRVAAVALFIAWLAGAQVGHATVRTTATYFTNVTNYCNGTAPCSETNLINVWSSTDSRGYPILAASPTTQSTGAGNGGYWVLDWTWNTTQCGSGNYCLVVGMAENDFKDYGAPSNAQYQISWVGRNGT